MPVNFQDLQNQVREKVGLAAIQAENQKKKLAEVRLCFVRFAQEGENLRKLIDNALEENNRLRCAIPLAEPLNTHIPAPPLPVDLAILAADGSQINPDRHAEIEFGLINVGVVRLSPGHSEIPKETTHTKFMSWDDVNTKEGPVGEDIIALERDLSERTILALLAREETLPVVSLTDGPLELYGEPRDRAVYQQKFLEYLTQLRDLAGLSVALGGYVDKPRSDLVVRLLELTKLNSMEIQQKERERPYYPVKDANLFFDLLQPGDRSAIFGIQSNSARRFTGELALHFFYLNVGRPGKPWLARVEIPAWVAGQTVLLNALHAVILQQVQVMGSKPYPYALHRAHETALVRFEEKDEISEMLTREMHRAGLEVGEASYKQSIKDNSGQRTRFTL
jgi:hypothetical protein